MCVCVLLVVGEKRLSTIMSAILNYLRYKAACDEDFRNMKCKIVSEQKYAKIHTGEFCDVHCALLLLVM